MNSTTKDCITCGSPIPVSAKKCRHCGSYQDFRRHLEFSQLTIALAIALISVSALLSEKIGTLYERLFLNPLSPTLNASIIDMSTTEIKFIINNIGKTRIYFTNLVTCRIAILKKNESIFEADKSNGTVLFHPPRLEQVDHFSYVIYQKMKETNNLIDSNSTSVITLPRLTGVEKYYGTRAPKGTAQSDCLFDYIGEDNVRRAQDMPMDYMFAYSISGQIIEGWNPK